MYFKPKKRLGQNFLIDKNILRKIVASAGLIRIDKVIEIGSGRGELTKLICPQVKKVFAFEIDQRLIPLLRQNLGDCKNVDIINQDILKCDLGVLSKPKGLKLKVLGNIPYYISTPIIQHLIKFRAGLSDIYLTVQKELACRIQALPGSKEYGPLSCFTQFYLIPQILFNIPKTCFKPSPNVDSSFIRLQVRNAAAVQINDQTRYFAILRKAFNQRRKTLRNSLRGTLPEAKLMLFFEKFSINPNIRPEDLSMQDFANLSNL